MLSTLIWAPLLGAAVIGLFPGNIEAKQLRAGAIAMAAALLLWTLWLFTQFDISLPTMQLTEYLPWIPTLGLSYSLGVDGLSLPLVALTNLLILIVIASSDSKAMQATALKRPRLFYSLVLLISTGMAGALLAQNLLLFFLFYELELIPFYLLILIWGGEKREYAGIKFLIYTAVSGILILAAFLAMNWLTGASSFDYAAIQTQDLTQTTQLILLTLMVLGFGIKIPLVPLHTWLPDAYVESSDVHSDFAGWSVGKAGHLWFGPLLFGDVPRNLVFGDSGFGESQRRCVCCMVLWRRSPKPTSSAWLPIAPSVTWAMSSSAPPPSPLWPWWGPSPKW